MAQKQEKHPVPPMRVSLFFPLALATLRILCAGFLAILFVEAVLAQAVPEGRVVTHREQTIKAYNPFSADELFKRIKVPPSPALSPEEALKSFEVADGFRIECVASEPLVVDPVFFEFDPDGRLWVIEYRGYMRDVEGTGEGDPICRIVVLEDKDGDGSMDLSTVFLDKLVMPRTLSFVQGGVLVAEPPNLWYCRDSDGDLVCDQKRRVGNYAKPGNPQHTENALMHAIDNWMYNANGSVRHRFSDGAIVEDATALRGQWGMTQDNHGRLFYNYENSSLHGDLVPSDFIRRNPHMPVRGRASVASALNVNVAADAHEVFPIRVTPGITLGGTELREDGRLRTFTVACGPSIYRGDQFPEEYWGAAVIPEAAGNLIRLDMLDTDGARIAARNAFGMQEFVASTDERFRPVSSCTGPDGAVYLCDLYHGIIEHMIYMMPYLRNQILSRHLDAPVDQGRIYRISHKGKPLGPPPRLSRASDEELVGHLSHPNGWWRDTAQRLLVERKAVGVTSQLRTVAAMGTVPLGRVHALWTLDGIGQLDWTTASAAIDAFDGSVRATAIRLCVVSADRPPLPKIFERLRPLLADTRPIVRLQLLLTIGDCAATDSVSAEAMGLMEEILVDHPDAPFGVAAISGLKNRELEMLEKLVDSPRWSLAVEEKTGVVEALATCVVQAGDAPRIGQLLQKAASSFKLAKSSNQKSWATGAIVAGIEASEISRRRWPKPFRLDDRPEILGLLTASQDAATSGLASRLLRIITWPGDTTVRETRPVLESLTAEQEKRRVQGEAVYNVTCYSCHKGDGKGQLGQAPPLADSEWVNGPADRLMRIVLHGLRGPVKVAGEEWNMQMPGLGSSSIMTDARLAGVLTYVRRAWGNYGSPVDPEHVAAIRTSSADRTTAWTVEDLLDPSKKTEALADADPLEPYREFLHSGDAEKGRFLFHANHEIRCNACHKVDGAGGGFVGPDLTGVSRRVDQEYLLESLIEPSRKIAKGYETIVVETHDGAIVSGTIVAERDGQLILALPTGGEVRIAIDRIADRVASSVSSMPPMGQAFTPGQIADIVAYLRSLTDESTSKRVGQKDQP